MHSGPYRQSRKDNRIPHLTFLENLPPFAPLPDREAKAFYALGQILAAGNFESVTLSSDFASMAVEEDDGEHMTQVISASGFGFGDTVCNLVEQHNDSIDAILVLKQILRRTRAGRAE